jgi:hypothetical protein
MDSSKTATANRNMHRSTYAADEPLVSAFKGLRGLLQRGTSAIGRKIFRSSDCQAHQRGWQIIPRHGGFSRTYRDPRFGYLAACMTCNGRGRNPHGINCTDCQGTGRVSIAPDVISKRRQGQS